MPTSVRKRSHSRRPEELTERTAVRIAGECSLLASLRDEFVGYAGMEGTRAMHRGYLSRIRYAFVIALVALFLVGCEKKQDQVVGPDTPPPSGGSISDEARLATLDTLSSVFSRLPGVDPASDRQAVLNYLKSRPEFEAAGISSKGENVWGRFVDGRLFLYVNNRQPSSAVSGSLAPLNRIENQPVGLNKTRDFFPASSSARIINSLGSWFGAAARSVDSIKRWCKIAGYTLVTPDIATVANLKKMKGDGIFYWATHGGYGERNDAKRGTTYALWTSDEVNAANEVKYLADLNTHNVQYMYQANDSVRGGPPSSAMHYCVDLWFIVNNMEFAENSLVYIDACGSGGFDPSYSFAFINAGIYLGWSLPVTDDDADRAARFFFDRTLGMNRNTPKLTPPQRPFFVEDILSDMTKRGLDVSGASRLTHPFEPVLAHLRLLAPSIGLTSGKGDVSSSTYTIGGSFADNPGAAGVVLLNNKPVTISSWSPTEVKIQKPQGGGTLVVTVRNVKSNPINLTEWNGTLEYTYTGRGTLKQHIVMNLKFWADVHTFRPNIIQPAMYMPFAGMGRPVEWMKTSSCTYEASGEFKDSFGEIQETWQGGATLPLSDLGSPGAAFSASALIDSAGTNSALFVVVSGTYTRWLKSSGESQQPLNFNVASIDAKHSMPDFSIKGGTIPMGGGTLTWSDLVATFPPDPKAAQ
jgi:hypothetical protein